MPSTSLLTSLTGPSPTSEKTTAYFVTEILSIQVSYRLILQSTCTSCYCQEYIVKLSAISAILLYLVGAWYRFIGPGGNVIPEECPAAERCSTDAPVFIHGTHPTGLNYLLVVLDN